MARSVNVVFLLGRLGADAHPRDAGGTSVANVSLATDYRTRDGDEITEWHDVVIWRVDRLAEYLKKGTQVHLQGRLQTRRWTDEKGAKRYRTEVVTSSAEVTLLGSPSLKTGA